MFFTKAKEKRETRIKKLEEQIERLEKARSETDPDDPKYKVISDNLNGLYEELEKHHTPFHKTPECKAIVTTAALSGLTAFALANVEQLHPVTSKLFPSALRNVFSNNHRRV